MANESAGKAAWAQELDEWLAPFLDALGHKSRRPWAPLYVRGLLGPGDRKSIQPMAERVAPEEHEQLHHFVATSPWDTAPLEAVLAREGQRLAGGPDAVLIIDDTTLLKQGKHSVGVARQYSGAAGKKANCQALVSLTLARAEVPVPLALRLFLPEEWSANEARCRKAGVPEERIRARSKSQIALEELDRLIAAGVEFGWVLADAGYGMGADFRRALSQRGLSWAVGILKTQKVYPADVKLLPPPPPKPKGRAPKHPVPTAERESVEAVLAALPWRKVTWRHGSKGPLSARFAAVRVRVADGPLNSRAQHLPGEVAWLVGEERASGEVKYYLTNHPPRTSLRRIAGTIKARWACEQAHQQMKEELGLDHFEGRSWSGLHHHAVLTMVAYGFLQHLRLKEAAAANLPPHTSAEELPVERGKKQGQKAGANSTPRTSAGAKPAGSAPSPAGDFLRAPAPVLP